MKKLALIIFSFGFLLTGSLVKAQNYEDYNFTWPKTALPERKVIPYPYIREADVKYSKRVERIIDVREKMNLALHYRKNPLNCIIFNNVVNGTLTGYMIGDSLDKAGFYTPEDVIARGSEAIPMQIINPLNPDDPYDLIDTVINEPFNCEKIIKYKIIEDWIFDHKYSRFFPRIIAIAPMFKPMVGGVELPEQPLFWLKYTEARTVFVNNELFNRFNDAARLSIDDFFEMRMFSSYVTKESNVFNYNINEFDEFKDDGIAALLESERIKNDLFTWEHDLWQY